MVRNYASRYPLLDSHGKTAPPKATVTVKALAEYLMTICENVEEKARVIYKWITENIAYDVAGYFSGKYGDLSPEGVLQSRKAVCSGYAALFAALCKECSIPCERICGYAKGYGHNTGQPFEESNHEWNAINIDDNWYLVEATWGAGYINGKVYSRKFIDEYFMMSPEQFITTHLPQDDKWQLLDKKISKKEFEDIVAVKPGAHKCGIRVYSHHDGIIVLNDKNTAEIKLGANKGTQLLVNVKERLGNNKEGASIENCSMCQQPTPGSVVINLILPDVKKKYNVHIFCKSRECTDYEYALTYVVEFEIKDREKIFMDEEGFPTIFGPFTDQNCYIFAPSTGKIRKPMAKFKVRVPGAKEVVVVVAGQWIHLNFVEDNIYEGNIDCEGVKPLDKVGVFVNFTGAFTGICQYTFHPYGAVIPTHVKKDLSAPKHGKEPNKSSSTKSPTNHSAKDLVQKRQPAVKRNSMKVI
jgi:hypothetical protein